MTRKVKLQSIYRKLVIISTAILLITTGCSKKEDPVPSEKGRIVVLMYHRIVNGQAENIYERNIDDFESDLMFLQENNIKILSFNDLGAISTTGEMPAGNSVIITFDDGDSSWYTLVKPMLTRYGVKATFFLWAYIIGHDSFITWDEVKDMSYYRLENGESLFTFGSHSYSHSYLLKNKGSFSSDEEYNSFLDYEMRVSKELIEQYIPGDVEIFSLPYGDGAGDSEIIAAAQRNGYKYIRTSIWSAIEDMPIDLFKIPSLPILDTTPQSLIGEYLGISK